MYRGLIGPPPFLEPLVKADGEAVYDRVAVEMFITVWVVLAFTLWFSQIRKRSLG